MSDSHLSKTDLEQYVLGSTSAEWDQGVEAHAAACPTCAAALQDEARLELALVEVAAAVHAQLNAEQEELAAFTPSVPPPPFTLSGGPQARSRGALRLRLTPTLRVSEFWVSKHRLVIGLVSAVALLLVLLPRPLPKHSPATWPAPLLVSCAAEGPLGECVLFAHFTGLMVRSPGALASVPRYEDLTDMALEGAAFIP